MSNLKSKTMARNYQQDWEMDSRFHRFRTLFETNPYFEIFSILKKYDEACLEARAQMIKDLAKFFPEEPDINV